MVFFSFIEFNSGNFGEVWRLDSRDRPAFVIEASADEFIAMGDFVYFPAFTLETGQELYRTRGTAGSTTLVRDLYPGQRGAVVDMAVLNDRLLLSADDGLKGVELWVYDP